MVTQPKAVGWVGNHTPVFAFAAEFVERLFLKMNQVADAGKFGIFSGGAQGAVVDIRGNDALGKRRPHRAACLFACFVPTAVFQLGPLFGSEVAVFTGGHVATDAGGFDRNRAATTERIDEWTVGVPETQLYHRRRQCFLERCIVGAGAIPSFVETGAGGVQNQGRLVFE